ncbi:MAG: hypothetical protein AABX08_01930 [Nanoarchaeota archaeon]
MDGEKRGEDFIFEVLRIRGASKKEKVNVDLALNDALRLSGFGNREVSFFMMLHGANGDSCSLEEAAERCGYELKEARMVDAVCYSKLSESEIAKRRLRSVFY